MGLIIESLAERVYAHGHALGLREAIEAGLPAMAASADLDSLMWKLLENYETELKLLEPLDAFEILERSDPYVEHVTMASIESRAASHMYQGTLKMEGQRAIPPTVNVSMTFPLSVPPDIDASELPQEVQAQITALQQSLAQQAQAAVQDALRQQAPLVGAQVRMLGARWVKDGA